MNKLSQAEFEKFYHKHLDKIYRFVFFQMKMNKEITEDLVSEIFIKALKNFDSYDSAKSESAWIFTIAKNHLANHWRDQKPTQALPEDEEKMLDKIWYDLAKNKHQKTTDQQAVSGLLSELQPNEKEIVTFHYLYGYNYAEIGKIKDMSETAAKVAAHRAIKKLSKLL